jgi:hypothetical protein
MFYLVLLTFSVAGYCVIHQLLSGPRAVRWFLSRALLYSATGFKPARADGLASLQMISVLMSGVGQLISS